MYDAQPLRAHLETMTAESPTEPGTEYFGHRILEAMRSASHYADAVYARVQRASAGHTGAILDFGAGDGAFVERFLKDGRSVTCVEPDAQNQQALRTLGTSVVTDINSLPDAGHDFIYTVNVLEHLVELERHMAELHRVLKPGGTLFVFVPAFNVLWTSLDNEVGHVQRFTRGSLTAFLEGAGFKVEQSSYFDSLGFIAALGVRLLEPLGLFRYSSSLVGFYDRMLFPISQLGDRVLSPLFGKNVIAVARKC